MEKSVVIDDKVTIHYTKSEVAESYGNKEDKTAGFNEDCMVEVKVKFMERLRRKPCWGPFSATVKFVAHFVSVCLVLFLGSLAFVHFEENHDSHKYSPPTDGNETWAKIETRLLKLTSKEVEELKRDIQKYAEEVRKLNAYRDEHYVNSKAHVFGKWFYFVTIASTTIGYGDVYPRTKEGKIFYIFFSLVGIPLMMTLIASCGIVMTSVNKKIFGVLNDCLWQGKKWISEDILSVFSILMLFSAYMAVGVAYIRLLEEQWTVLDGIYFWFVTFTTVGFGDLNIALQHQIDYVIILVVYRTFGLALLAGVINALIQFSSRRKAELEKRVEEKKSLIISKTMRSLKSG